MKFKFHEPEKGQEPENTPVDVYSEKTDGLGNPYFDLEQTTCIKNLAGQIEALDKQTELIVAGKAKINELRTALTASDEFKALKQNYQVAVEGTVK